MSSPIKVNMLGRFSISAPGVTPEQELSLTGRSRRIWTLVAYLIMHRDRGIPAQELIDLLWPDSDSDNPISTLQNNVSRARSAMEKMGLPDAKNLIIYKEGLYRWAGEIETDYDAFERAVREASAPDAAELSMEKKLEVLKLYAGDFLPEAAGELWCMSVNMYYRTLYTRMCGTVVKQLMDAARYDEVEQICSGIFANNPLEEKFTVSLMRALTMNGKAKRTLEIYDQVRQLYKETYGIMPSPELEIERSAAEQDLHDRALDNEDLALLLDGLEEKSGSFFCDSHSFCKIVNLHAREIARTKSQAQVVLMHLKKNGESQEKQMILMKQMEKTLLCSLRTGDPFTRIGATQFAILLPSASPENGKVVVGRIMARYKSSYSQNAEFSCRVMDLADLKGRNFF